MSIPNCSPPIHYRIFSHSFGSVRSGYENEKLTEGEDVDEEGAGLHDLGRLVRRTLDHFDERVVVLLSLVPIRDHQHH